MLQKKRICLLLILKTSSGATWVCSFHLTSSYRRPFTGTLVDTKYKLAAILAGIVLAQSFLQEGGGWQPYKAETCHAFTRRRKPYKERAKKTSTPSFCWDAAWINKAKRRTRRERDGRRFVRECTGQTSCQIQLEIAVDKGFELFCYMTQELRKTPRTRFRQTTGGVRGGISPTTLSLFGQRILKTIIRMDFLF